MQLSVAAKVLEGQLGGVGLKSASLTKSNAIKSHPNNVTPVAGAR